MILPIPVDEFHGRIYRPAQGYFGKVEKPAALFASISVVFSRECSIERLNDGTTIRFKQSRRWAWEQIGIIDILNTTGWKVKLRQQLADGASEVSVRTSSTLEVNIPLCLDARPIDSLLEWFRIYFRTEQTLRACSLSFPFEICDESSTGLLQEEPSTQGPDRMFLIDARKEEALDVDDGTS